MKVENTMVESLKLNAEVENFHRKVKSTCTLANMYYKTLYIDYSAWAISTAHVCGVTEDLRPVMCAWCVMPTLLVTPVQLVHSEQVRPGIGQNESCALDDCSTSRPEGHSQPRELWIYSYTRLQCMASTRLHTGTTVGRTWEFPVYQVVRDTCLTLYCLVRPTTTELPQ